MNLAKKDKCHVLVRVFDDVSFSEKNKTSFIYIEVNILLMVKSNTRLDQNMPKKII